MPETNDKINDREKYYYNLITRDLKKSFMDKHEQTFMIENLNYFDEPDKPNWTKIIKAAVHEHLNFLKELSKIK